jgi:hypothetical protein
LVVEKGKKKKLKPVCAPCFSCFAMLSLRCSFYLCLIACVEWQCVKPLLQKCGFVGELFQPECGGLLIVGAVLAVNNELFDR